jgi:hypothetical protein
MKYKHLESEINRHKAEIKVNMGMPLKSEIMNYFLPKWRLFYCGQKYNEITFK